MDGAISPLWIGFVVGVLVAGLGLFRLIRGPLAFGLGDTEHKHPDSHSGGTQSLAVASCEEPAPRPSL